MLRFLASKLAARRRPAPHHSIHGIAALALSTVAAVLSICTLPRPVHAQSSERPNIVVILADDLGYGDLSCYGAANLYTPHIDALAAAGMRMPNFYANCCVCSPTRAALLTGRYPELVGVPGVIRTHRENNWGYLDPHAVLLPQLLSAAGYHTAIIGKWHLGLRTPNTPNQRGFDFFRGFLGDMMDDYFHHLRHGENYMRLNEEAIEPVGHATDLFTDWACEYLQKRAASKPQTPFFLYLAYNAPHTPIQPPTSWLERVRQREPETPEPRAKLVALIEHLDESVGRVLQCLQQTSLARDTIVVFTSDNGGQLEVGANNGALRGGKQSMYEGGLKVPFVVRWPDKIAAGSLATQIGVTMDLFPTFCEFAAVRPLGPIDGVSLRQVWLDPNAELPPRDIYFHRREGGSRYAGLTISAVRQGDWKLVQNSPFAPFELIHLAQDPREATNLAEQQGTRLRELVAALQLQIQRGGAIPWQEPE